MAHPQPYLPVYCDARNLWTYIPGPDGEPFLLRYPRTNTGLSQMLTLICKHAYDHAGPPVPTLPPKARVGTLEQTLAAKDILRKLRVIP